ncbi:hypothetical protein [Actinomadura rayongensis]|uniref:Uncharacterized protein n=1 Tax=Actinomadura rayongensis TaxID=1429076 RepID=A0A6I4W757_9ACTN|nr:hypothetical protein [Actinomadura rayongensis]MXQ66027.1 hypothetical protein [Actinomadura rayongensis]
MTNIQQPSMRRSGHTPTTAQPPPEATQPKGSRRRVHPHGTDKGAKGGGQGGGTPPAQRPDHPD